MLRWCFCIKLLGFIDSVFGCFFFLVISLGFLPRIVLVVVYITLSDSKASVKDISRSLLLTQLPLIRAFNLSSNNCALIADLTTAFCHFIIFKCFCVLLSDLFDFQNFENAGAYA